MWALVGILAGLILHRLIIVPIERKKAREECICKGLVPRNTIYLMEGKKRKGGEVG